MSEVTPIWLACWAGFCMFAYETLDAIDGKQARRLGVSGPLGQLFDHGCDAVNTIVGMIVFLHHLQMGTSTNAFIMTITPAIIFLMAQWEE